MPLDPQIEIVLEALRGRPGLRDVPLEILRNMPLPPMGEISEMAEVRDVLIPAEPAPIQARLYRPEARRDLPLLVYYHGGGFALGSIESHDAICRRLAFIGGFAVLSVGYRLAPEHKFPAAPDDALRALLWATEAANELGIDPSRIAVGGDSAGGNLAAVTAVRARDESDVSLAAQLLIYPAVSHHTPPTASIIENAEGYFLGRDDMEYFMSLYLPDEAATRHPHYAVMKTPDLGGLPPAYVITAQYDPLRDEGKAYAARLREEGVAVETVHYDGMIHGFYGMAGVDVGREALDLSAEWLRGIFAA